ncbi:GIY-YIG nuclease family protein [Nocardioides bruguierae]|uniref:GIY-YIG nuclease family protein n=1 Tax=Nocardioides bruguierae TaxID=2945102 RepID=A0A9X2IDN4_9ACTN|nr:GIY-YIG nuclease family protein [Nocardioides bruguierae]MCM0619941.1 GIY-YIG nuclease family protein [Nocardioides bruguierae]
MAWTYMLRCADGAYYVGSTTDLGRRLEEHQERRGAAFTKPEKRRPVTLVWSQEFDRVEDAFRYEKQLQNWSRAKREALIAGDLDAVREAGRRPGARPRHR